MVLIRLLKYSLLLFLYMIWSGVSNPVSGQCTQHNRDVLKAGVLNFFGKEQLAIMQRRTFGFDIIYGKHRGTIEIKIQKKGKEKRLSDTIAAVLKRFLDQAVTPQLCKGNQGKVRVDERTSFDRIKEEQRPLISLTAGNTDGWNDTFRQSIAIFRERYPDDCERLHGVRGVTYKVVPLQQPVISHITYAGGDTGDQTAAFLLRFRTFLEGRLALPYPVTAEGCVPDYIDDTSRAPVPEAERIWCIVNRFGYARYFLFKMPTADCD